MKKSNLFIIFLLFAAAGLAQNGRSEKRGIAYGHHTQADMSLVSQGLSWWYNWSYQPESGVANVFQGYNMDFVPMTWNNSFNEAGLRAYYASHPDAKYLLGFNEPNFTAQANMKPSVVAAAWPRLEAIAAEFGLEIVGPAVNWCGNCVSEEGVIFTNPYAYLDSFFSKCPGCKVDYIAVHNYMCYTGALSGYIDGFKKYGKKIWLTEYACWDQNNITLQMQKNLMKGSIDYLENDTMVFRYAWFTGNRSGAYPYLDIYAPQSGKLTELGQFYVDYRAFVPDTSYYPPIPGRIEAEHYTNMFGIATQEVSDFDGVDNVGWIDVNDWLDYNIEVPTAGEYYVYFRISSNAATSLILKVDGQNTDTLIVPSSGGWQNWKTLGLQSYLPVGKHKLQVFAQKANFNLNWIRVSDHANTLPTANAGTDQIVILPTASTTLSGECTDPDGDALQYKWTKVSGPSCTITNATDANANVTGLVKGKYIFNLTISDGTEIASDRVIVDVLYPTGVEDVNINLYNIYPNPVTDKLFIQNQGISDKTEVFLMDTSGRLMLTKSFPKGTALVDVDLSAITRGYYILKITGDSGTDIHQIIKL